MAGEIKKVLFAAGMTMATVAVAGSLFRSRDIQVYSYDPRQSGAGPRETESIAVPPQAQAAPLEAQVAPVNPNVEHGRFPRVDQYFELFSAAVDQAINSWIELKGDLVIDRKIVFDQLIDAVRAIATIESGGDPNATSSANARGIMQLIPKVGLNLNSGEDPDILYDPHLNIFRGTWYYYVLWMESYEELGYPADLDVVDRLAAARYYRGGANVAADPATWSGEIWHYVEKFEAAKQASR